MESRSRRIADLQSSNPTSLRRTVLPALKEWLHCVPVPTALLSFATRKIALAAVLVLIAGGVQAASIYGSTSIFGSSSGSLYSVDVDTGVTTFLSPLTGPNAGFNLAAGAPGYSVFDRPNTLGLIDFFESSRKGDCNHWATASCKAEVSAPPRGSPRDST